MGRDADLCQWFWVWICDHQTRRQYPPMTHRQLQSRFGHMAPFFPCPCVVLSYLRRPSCPPNVLYWGEM